MNSIEKLIRLIKIPKIEKEITDARTTSDKIVKANLNERINSDVVRLENIAKESNTEIVNARVGVDGNNYESLNNRIKHEVGQLQSQISNASDLPFTGEYISAEHSVKGICKDMVIKGKTMKFEPESLIGGEQTYTLENYATTPNLKVNKKGEKTTVKINIATKGVEDSKSNIRYTIYSYTGTSESGWFKAKTGENTFILPYGVETIQLENRTGVSITLTVDVFQYPILPPTIKSVSETSNKISILSCGKNIFDGEIEEGRWVASVGAKLEKVVTSKGGFRIKNIIKVKGETDYKATYNQNGQRGFYVEADSNFIILKVTPIVDNFSIRTLSNTKFLAMYTVDVFQNLIEFKQLEEGTKTTTYEPYKEDKRDISLSGAFGKWNSINFNTSELIEGTFKKVLNGASGETYNFLDEGTNSTRFYMDLSNVKPSQLDMICNKFKTLSTTGIDEEAIEIDSSKRLIIRILKSKLTGYLTTMTAIEKVNLFKIWLTTDNVEFYCQLATPIITKLNLDAMTSYDAMTHVFTDNTDELSPTIECKIPCNTPAVISTLSARNTVLQSENNTLKSKNIVLEEGQVMLKTENEEIKNQLDNQGLAVAESQFNNEYRFMVLESGGVI